MIFIRSVIRFILLVFMILNLTGCLHSTLKGEGEYIEKEYVLAAASGLEVEDICLKNGVKTENVTLNVYEADAPKVVIKAQENILETLSCQVRMNTLKITGKRTLYYACDEIKIEVYGYCFKAVELENATANFEDNCISKETVSFDFSGAAELKMEKIESKKVELDFSGASKMDVNAIVADKVEVDISGAGELKCSSITATQANVVLSGASKISFEMIKIQEMGIDFSGASKLDASGEVEKLEVELSGASTINMKDAVANTAELDLSGASVVHICVKEYLKVSASGASTIHYYQGEPAKIDKKLSGGSVVVAG